MTILYKSCTPIGGVPSYICDPCAEGEKGRVRSVMFIDKTLLSELAATAEGEAKNIEVRLKDVIKGGDASKNIPLKPGDMVSVKSGIF